MTKRLNPRMIIDIFNLLMEILNPSKGKVIAYITTLLLLVFATLYMNQITLFKMVITFYSYFLGLSVYSLNGLSQVQSDIDYLDQTYYGYFPTRQTNGFLWETPDGQRIETLRLAKHYGSRLTLICIGYFLLVMTTLFI